MKIDIDISHYISVLLNICKVLCGRHVAAKAPSPPWQCPAPVPAAMGCVSPPSISPRSIHGFIAASLGALIALWLMGLHGYQLQMSSSECLQGRSAKGMCDVSGALPAWEGCRDLQAEEGAEGLGVEQQEAQTALLLWVRPPLGLVGCIKGRKYSIGVILNPLG